MSKAKTATRALLIALIALQFAWFAWLLPTRSVPGWWLATVFALPLLAILLLHWRGWRAAGLWAGILALGYFSFGAMEAWATPAARLPAMSQAILSASLVLACSWDGLRSRFARKPA